MRMTSVYNILLIKVIRVSVAILCFSCSTALWTSLTVCMYVLCMLKYMAPFYCKLTNIANYRFSVSIFGFEGGWGWITHKQTHNKRICWGNNLYSPSKVVFNDLIQKAPWRSTELQYLFESKIMYVIYLQDHFIVCDLTKYPAAHLYSIPYHNIWILIFKMPFCSCETFIERKIMRD